MNFIQSVTVQSTVFSTSFPMKRISISVILIGIFFCANTQQLSLIKDINPGAASSNLSFLTAVNNIVFFAANDGINGMELWKSNGTSAGTVLVKDINTGSSNSSIGNLTNVNGTLFFVANDGTTGVELWKSDGTTAGTVMVKDIRPGSMGSGPSALVNVNGILFFSADDGVYGSELWKSDGTADGTVMAKDINLFSGSSYPSSLASMNGVLFFNANDGENGAELWKSDGTETGTVLVKDIWPGSDDGYPADLVNTGSTLFFSANDGDKGIELWKTDGTTAGTVMVKDIWTGNNDSGPFSLKNINGTLFFSADNGSTGIELWKSSGAAANTVLVKDIWPGGESGAVGNFSELISRLIFTGNDGVNGYKTWQSDGSAAGTQIATGIANPGEGIMRELVGTADKVFASITESESGRELWGTSFMSVLPLSLTDFRGQLVNRNAVLNWKTENETRTSTFIVERSIDRSNYYAVGNVVSANTPGAHQYMFNDPGVTSLGTEIIYYRLKQVDMDGAFAYSKIVALPVNQKESIAMIYPNPANHEINLSISMPKPGRINYQVTDITGKIVIRDVKQLSSGGNSFLINIDKLAAGIYHVVLHGATINTSLQFVKE